MIRSVREKGFVERIRQSLGFYPEHTLEKVAKKHCIWVHAASVGEIVATSPLIKEFHKEFPQTPILVSVVTTSGYEMANRIIKDADAIIYFPLDLPFLAGSVLRRIHPRVFLPVENNNQNQKKDNLRKGFSDAYQMHRFKKTAYPNKSKECADQKAVVTEYSAAMQNQERYVVLDLETTGLNATTDRIIEVGAVKDDQGTISVFNALICIDDSLPKEIVQLTGITDEMLRQGQPLKAVLRTLVEFIGDTTIVGYNISFDLKFLNSAFNRCGMPSLNNQVIDLIKIVRREQLFQENYRLETTLKSYGIADKVPHRALQDAQLIFQLSKKVNVFGQSPA